MLAVIRTLVSIAIICLVYSAIPSQDLYCRLLVTKLVLILQTLSYSTVMLLYLQYFLQGQVLMVV
jgi:hypothetical protein